VSDQPWGGDRRRYLRRGRWSWQSWIEQESNARESRPHSLVIQGWGSNGATAFGVKRWHNRLHSNEGIDVLYRRILVLTLSLFAASETEAQDQAKPKRKIELIGLHRWTYDMVQDSLAKYYKGADASLEGHACAVNLRKIGFVRAAVQMFADPSDPENSDKWSSLITVVEPQDSMRVRTTSTFKDSLPARPEWASIRAAVSPTDTFRYYRVPPVLQFYGRYRAGQKEQAIKGLKDVGAPDGTQKTFDLLAERTSDQERVVALEVLATDRNPDNRVIAASILANFAKSDSVWYALVRALRDPEESVGSVAGMVLSGLVKENPHAIDWSPVQEDLRYLFGGTNVWELNRLIKVLDQTQIDPKLARSVFKDNAELIASYAASSVKDVSEPAQHVLKRVSGKDFGADRKAWIAWANNL
jgi:hypothetical protein